MFVLGNGGSPLAPSRSCFGATIGDFSFLQRAQPYSLNSTRPVNVLFLYWYWLDLDLVVPFSRNVTFQRGTTAMRNGGAASFSLFSYKTGRSRIFSSFRGFYTDYITGEEKEKESGLFHSIHIKTCDDDVRTGKEVMTTRQRCYAQTRYFTLSFRCIAFCDNASG